MLLSLALVAACQESSTTSGRDLSTTDGNAARDVQQASDGATDSRAIDANPLGDGSSADVTVSDGAAVKDSKPVADQKVISPDASVDAAKAPDATLPTLCAVDNDCRAFEDCCTCRTHFAWETPASCKMACAVTKCKEIGIDPKAAYCVQGRCKLTVDAPSCTTSADCRRIDDCCNCLALPNSVKGPTCPTGINCLINTCAAHSLSGYKAACISGQCRLVP